MEFKPVAELACCNIKNLVEVLHEFGDSLFFVLDNHALYGYAHNIYSGKTQVAATNGGFFAIAVFKNTCSASHCGNLITVSFRVVSTPFVVMVECRVKIYKVREKPARCDFTSQFV